MRKCTNCGKEYPDGALRCLVDEYPLIGGEGPPPLPADAPPIINVPPVIGEPTPASVKNEGRSTRVFELALVCAIAFGGSILVSTYHLINPRIDSSQYNWGALSWVNSGLHEITTLLLLWYVLQRRSRTWRDLGCQWKLKDFAMSIPLVVVASLASTGMYYLLQAGGFTPVSRTHAIRNVEHILFNAGVSLATILFQFLNPFYEELVARAFVMTEVKQLTNSSVIAIFVSTALQTSYHFYQGVPLALSAGALFLVFSIYYAKTGRILPVILAHLYFDVGATLLYWLRTG